MATATKKQKPVQIIVRGVTNASRRHRSVTDDGTVRLFGSRSIRRTETGRYVCTDNKRFGKGKKVTLGRERALDPITGMGRGPVRQADAAFASMKRRSKDVVTHTAT